MRINVDWDGCNYSSLNGFHPIFKFLLKTDPSAAGDAPSFVVNSYREKLALYERYDQTFKTELSEIRNKNSKNSAFNWTWRFFDIDEQFLTEIFSKDIYFCHTFPLSLGLRPFVFHIEDVKSLFLPFISEFNLRVSDVCAHPAFNLYKSYIAEILNSKTCLAIFCHYEATAAALAELFPGCELNSKVRMIDLLSLHNGSTSDLVQRRSNKKRLIFTHSYHGNVNSIRARGLETFFELCRKLKNAGLDEEVIPTLLLPSEYSRGLPNDLKIDVFRGYVPDDVYESILDEAKFLFLSSPWVHTKVIIDCARHCVVPIVRTHLAYEELGFSKENTIDLGRPSYDALRFSDEGEEELNVNLDFVINQMRSFLGSAEQCRAPFKKDISFNIPATLSEFGKELNSLIRRTDLREGAKYAGFLEKLTKEHFSMSPRFLTHCKFNGLTVLTNRRHYLYRRQGPMPASMSQILCSGFFYRSPKGVSIFETLCELRDVLSWMDWTPPPGRAWLYEIKNFLSRHQKIYIFARKVYRFLRRPLRILGLQL